MAQEEKKISRSKKKRLLKRLKEQMAPKRGLLYLAAFLSWVQFLMRVVSFAIIAATLASLYQGGEVHVLQVAVSLLVLSGLGYLISLFAKNLQGIVSQYARNQLKAQELHGRITEILRLLRKLLLIPLVCLIRIQGVKPLQIIQKAIPHIHVRSPVAVHNPLSPLLHENNRNGNQGQRQEENQAAPRKEEEKDDQNRQTVKLSP